jgi:hypothetical protein
MRSETAYLFEEVWRLLSVMSHARCDRTHSFSASHVSHSLAKREAERRTPSREIKSIKSNGLVEP